MKKTTKDNYRLEVYPSVPFRPSHDDYIYALDSISDDIKRHVDDVDSVSIEWDTEEICEFCGYGWELDKDNLPVCCEKAIKEAMCKNHITELSGGDTCQKQTKKNFKSY